MLPSWPDGRQRPFVIFADHAVAELPVWSSSRVLQLWFVSLVTQLHGVWEMALLLPPFQKEGFIVLRETYLKISCDYRDNS